MQFMQIINDILGILGTLIFEMLASLLAAIFVGCLGAWFCNRLNSAIYRGADSDLQSIPATILGGLVGAIIGGVCAICGFFANDTTGTIVTHVLGLTALLLAVGEVAIRLTKAVQAKKPRK